jgi:hypothetical protein
MSGGGALFRLAANGFGFGCLPQCFQYAGEQPERVGQVGAVAVRVGVRQLPVDRYRLLGHWQRVLGPP